MERARSVKIPPRGPAEKLVDFQARLHKSWGFRAVIASNIHEPLMEMVFPVAIFIYNFGNAQNLTLFNIIDNFEMRLYINPLKTLINLINSILL